MRASRASGLASAGVAWLLLLLSFGALAQEASVERSAAFIRRQSVGIEVRLAAPLPAGSTLSLRAIRVAGGRLFSEGPVPLKPRGASRRDFQLLTSAVGPTGTEIAVGDRLEMKLELDGAPLGNLSLAVGTGGLPAASEPTRPPPPTIPAAPPQPEAPPATPTPVPTPTAPPLPTATPAPTQPPATPVFSGVSLTVPPSPTPSATRPVPATATAPTKAVDAERGAAPPTPSATPPEPTATAEPTPPVATTAAAGGAPPGRGDGLLGRLGPWAIGGAGLLLLSLAAGVVALVRRGRARAAVAPTSPPGRPAPAPPPPSGPAPSEKGAPAIDGLEVVSRLARGGLCDIFVVRLENERRRGALKVLRPEFRMSADLSENLRREGEILWFLAENYPDGSFVDIMRQGSFPDGSQQSPYLVLEYVDGPDLRAWVLANGAMAPAEALRVTQSVAGGLACLHASSLIHGDVSPENVLRTSHDGSRRKGKGIYRLIDFGDARRFDLERSDTEIAGKPSFISPEQAAGQAATPASDVYSLGMLLYFLYTGHAAFQSHHPGEVLRMHRDSQVAFPTGTPPGVRRLVLTLCQKTPELRPSASEVVQMVEDLLSERGDS